MRNVNSITLSLIKNVSKSILKKSDSELLQWLQEKYPCATFADARTERRLMEIASKAQINNSGIVLDAIFDFHLELSHRNIGHSNR